jgi:RNA polymerase sigma-70 factor (ECF subfamily)
MISTVSSRQPDQSEERIRDYISKDFARLVVVITVVCGNRAVAEELVQEAMAKAWKEEMQGDQIESLGAWVMTVALNLARSRRRRAAIERRSLERLQGGVVLAGGHRSELDLADIRVDLLNAIKRLPRRQREVVALHYFMDMGGAEVSRSLDLSEGAVKALLFRARRSLEEALREPESSVPDEGTDRAEA